MVLGCVFNGSLPPSNSLEWFDDWWPYVGHQIQKYLLDFVIQVIGVSHATSGAGNIHFRRQPPLAHRRFQRNMTVRAIVYEHSGDPASVLYAVTLPPRPLSGRLVSVKVLLSPINPSDLHVVHGSYAIQPAPRKLDVGGEEKTLYFPGNEGLGEITEVGPDVKSVKRGDWVVFSKSQSGTWSSAQILEEEDVIKVDQGLGISAVNASTLAVNPVTAHRLLSAFVDLKPGDWVAQNAANSSVGLAVIQFAKGRGIRTINLVRKKDDFAETERLLKGLGADVVLTYDDISSDERVSELVSGKEVRLLLDCVGGQATKDTVRLASKNAHLVVYGAMSEEDLRIPPFLLVFKDIHVRGFWRTGWFNSSTLEERSKFIDEVIRVMVSSKIGTPVHEIVKIGGTLSDEEATRKVRETLERVNKGTGGTKIILEVETPGGV